VPDGAIVLIVALVAATAFGLWRRRTDGAVKEVDASAHGVGGHVEVPAEQLMHVSAGDLGAPLGQQATLVQFSSAFCQPCRATRAVLAAVAEMVDGVAHVEIDAEANLELVRRLHVMRTPTVFVLDGDGAIRRRAAGTPRRADIIAALGEFVTVEEGAK